MVSRTEGIGLAFKWSREKSSVVIEYREQDVFEKGYRFSSEKLRDLSSDGSLSVSAFVFL